MLAESLGPTESQTQTGTKMSQHNTTLNASHSHTHPDRGVTNTNSGETRGRDNTRYPDRSFQEDQKRCKGDRSPARKGEHIPKAPPSPAGSAGKPSRKAHGHGDVSARKGETIDLKAPPSPAGPTSATTSQQAQRCGNASGLTAATIQEVPPGSASSHSRSNAPP